MLFTKEGASNSHEQVELLYREYNIHYIDFVVSQIYPLLLRVDLCFSLYKLTKFPPNHGKVHFEGLVHLLRYISNNKNLGLEHYSKIENENLSDLLRQASIKNENKFMVLSYYSW